MVFNQYILPFLLVVSKLRGFIDLTIALYMFMLSFIFYKWKRICAGFFFVVICIYIVDVVEWSRALDVRLSEWCCSVSMVWVQIPSREEQKFDSSKI